MDSWPTLEVGGHHGRSDDRHTSQRYKDDQKMQVFKQIDEAAAYLGVSPTCIHNAKTIFTIYRDHVEKAFNVENGGIIAACLIMAERDAKASLSSLSDDPLI